MTLDEISNLTPVPEFQLGYTASYDGTSLGLSVWVEQGGQVITASSITGARLLAANGTPMSGAAWADNSSPTNGVFSYSLNLTINAATRFIFDCSATVGGVSFPLRFGMSRP